MKFECGHRSQIISYLLSLRSRAQNVSFCQVVKTRKLGAAISYGFNEPFHVAAGSDHLHIVKNLVKMGANISSMKDFAVRVAAFEGHLNIHRNKFPKYIHLNKYPKHINVDMSWMFIL